MIFGYDFCIIIVWYGFPVDHDNKYPLQRTRQIMKAVKILGVLALFGCLAACQTTTNLGRGIGVVYMHGRGGEGYGKYDRPLIDSMKFYGVMVVAPDMPWAGSRGVPDYSGTMEDAMEIISKEVNALRTKGLKKIIVGGMSAGGNTALAYGAYVGDADGIMAVAPAPAVAVMNANPDTFAKTPLGKKLIAKTPKKKREQFRRIMRRNNEQVNKAIKLIAAGKGDEPAIFIGSNMKDQGVFHFKLRIMPRIYLSYNDPKGMRAMPLNSSKFKKSTPLLWINDNQGLTRKLEREYAFDKAPHNPKSRYVELDVTHLAAPRASREVVKEWLLSLLDKGQEGPKEDAKK